MIIFGILVPMWLLIPVGIVAALSVINLAMWIMAPIIGIKILFKIVKILFKILKMLLPIMMIAVIAYVIYTYAG